MKTSENLIFEEEFFSRIREKEVWDKLSEGNDLDWNMQLIKKHADKWNWKLLSGNHNINWTESMLAEFKDRICWNELSDSIRCCRHYNLNYGHSPFLKIPVLEKYENLLNWERISDSYILTSSEIIERFAHRLDWSLVIRNLDIEWTFDLFHKFKKYMTSIDAETLLSSHLWNCLIEHDKKIIMAKILID